MFEGGDTLTCYDCFAHSDRRGHFYCLALNVKECDFPNCKTFKTKEQCKKEREKTIQRLKELGRT